VVVKTTNGNRSGITHAGGRYVPPDGVYRTEVMREMRNLGMEPPQPPFLIAPGEFTLYHEWGHHVDRVWSQDSHDVRFSFRWFSRFYQLGTRTPRFAQAGQNHSADCIDMGSSESGRDAAVTVAWWHLSSELFADLFEDWMRGKKKVGWDHCEPSSLNAPASHGHPLVSIKLLAGVTAVDVRAETYRLFDAGIRSAPDPPSVRAGLLGPDTDDMVGRLSQVLVRARAGDW
jgi:hypothetical protein